MKPNSPSLLEYYKRELTYLRRMGSEFAQQFPKVAQRLELGIDQCPDPHIERLIESFAFLTARVQHQMESEFPELSAALLGVLYPQFVNPVPAMTVARFEIDPEQVKLTSAHRIPRHTMLFARTDQDHLCHFMTCYPVDLWPLRVIHAGLESTDRYDFLDTMPNVAMVLRLRIETMAQPLSSLGLDRLRFFLNGDRMLVHALHEMLFCNVFKVALIPQGGDAPVLLSPESIAAVGFDPREAVLPYPPNAHEGYRLLQEYFTFPDKFLFFDIQGLDIRSEERGLDILILLNQVPTGRLTIDHNTFCLGCTPIINLFPKTSDPIRLDQRRYEYRVQPDQRREKITEIHSIQSVSGVMNPRDQTEAYAPFFSYHHSMDKNGQNAFWISRRRATGRKDLPGTDVFLSFVDLNFNPHSPPSKTVYAHMLCTNRTLAEEIPAGALLQIEQAAPLARIVTLAKPTSPIAPPLRGAALWRLISHLSLNHLSLTQPEESLKALAEILRLYSFTDHPDTHQQINGIREMACQPVVRRFGTEAWRGFCRGLEVSLVFDERLYVGGSAFLLASVLNRFFPLYASVNTFTQLKIKSIQREGIWKTWPPMAGEQILA